MQPSCQAWDRPSERVTGRPDRGVSEREDELSSIPTILVSF